MMQSWKLTELEPWNFIDRSLSGGDSDRSWLHILSIEFLNPPIKYGNAETA